MSTYLSLETDIVFLLSAMIWQPFKPRLNASQAKTVQYLLNFIF